jgi:hypothetical protein
MSGDTCPSCGARPSPVFVIDEQETSVPDREPRQPVRLPMRWLVPAAVLLLAAVAGVALMASGQDDGPMPGESIEVSEDPTGRLFALVGANLEVVDDAASRRSTVVEGSFTQAIIVGDRLVVVSDRPGELSSISVADPAQRVALGIGSWVRPSASEGRVWLGPDGGAREVGVSDGAVHRRVELEPDERFLADLGGPVLVSERVGPTGGAGELNLRVKAGAGPEFPRTAQYVAARPGLVATLRCGEGCALHLTPVGGEGRERTLAGEGIRTWNRGSFSPDGELLVAMRRVDEGEAVTITNPAEEWSRSYVLGDGFTTEPVWSADSRWLFLGFGPDSDTDADRIVAFNRDAGFSSRTLSIMPRAPFNAMAVR